jgi:hypothetical protein
MNDIKLSDHRPVFADIVLYQQSKNNKTSVKSAINFYHFHTVSSFYFRSPMELFQ